MCVMYKLHARGTYAHSYNMYTPHMCIQASCLVHAYAEMRPFCACSIRTCSCDMHNTMHTYMKPIQNPHMLHKTCNHAIQHHKMYVRNCILSRA